MSSCQQYESYLAGIRFPGQTGINYSMYGHQSGQCLQKQGFSIKLWCATRNNGSNKLFWIPQIICHQKLIREVSCAWHFIKQLISSGSSIVHLCRVPLPKLPPPFLCIFWAYWLVCFYKASLYFLNFDKLIFYHLISPMLPCSLKPLTQYSYSHSLTLLVFYPLYFLNLVCKIISFLIVFL